MEHIRASWWTKRKKHRGPFVFTVKILLKYNIERHILKLKRVYKIEELTGIFIGRAGGVGVFISSFVELHASLRNVVSAQPPPTTQIFGSK
jgi:hypothetical protein